MGKLLTQSQRDALAGTNKIPLKEWTMEQCQQLKDIYDQVKNSRLGAIRLLGGVKPALATTGGDCL